MHHQDADVVRASVRENSAAKVDDTWPSLITPTDPTATLSLRREGSGKQGKIWPGDGKLLPQPWLKPTGTPSQPLTEISISGGRARAEARSPIAADAFTEIREP